MFDYEALSKALSELNEEEVVKLLEEFVASKPTEEEAHEAVTACQNGMSAVGSLFETGEYFVGDLIFAGELLQKAIDILKPSLGEKSIDKVGTIVLGTVAGDLHDIGKNIFKGMVEAAGFEVHDIGIDQPASAFVDKIKEVKPDILGMSGLLTLSIESMEKTVKAIKEAGLRETIKIIIGGNAVSREACELIGADAYTTNAAEGVECCQKWVNS